MLKHSFSQKVIIIVIIILLYFNHAFSHSKYYYSLASGISYNDSILKKPLNNFNILYPYFEFGKILKKGAHLGFNCMLSHNFKDASDIHSFYFGANYKYFIIRKIFHFGGGLSMHIEDKKVYEDNSTGQSNIDIQNAAFLLNFNVRFGLIYNIWDNRNILIDFVSGQSFGKPYPYFTALFIGIFSYY